MTPQPFPVLCAIAEGVQFVTMQNGRAHALSLAMIRALHDVINNAVADPDIRVIVIEGPGHIFCAGHDLKEIALHRADDDGGEAYLNTLFDACADLMQAIALCAKPTIACVEGIATAAGLQLVAACDLAFAAEAATFCLPGVRNGGFCTTPAVAVSRAVGQKALMELLLSGEDRGADWALRVGLVNEVLPMGALAARVETFARTLASRNPGPIRDGKACTLAGRDLPLDQAYAQATRVMVGHFMDQGRLIAEAKSPFVTG